MMDAEEGTHPESRSLSESSAPHVGECDTMLPSEQNCVFLDIPSSATSYT